MITPEEYQKRKKKLEQLKGRLDFARGAVDELLRELKDDYGVDNLEAGEELLKKMKEKEAKQENRAEEAYQKFEVAWNEFLAEGEE